MSYENIAFLKIYLFLVSSNVLINFVLIQNIILKINCFQKQVKYKCSIIQNIILKICYFQKQIKIQMQFKSFLEMLFCSEILLKCN